MTAAAAVNGIREIDATGSIGIIKALSESIGTPRSKRNLKRTHTSSERFASPS